MNRKEFDMKKIALPLLLAILMAALLASPALAEPQAAPIAAPIAAPAGTASPRDWSKLAPDGELLASAVKAEAAILMDAKTGKVLFEKDADSKRFPASITKIMTCLVALDSGKPLSSIVTASKNLPKLPADASDIKLKTDEQMTLEDLLYGLMLPSGNDAANAIAFFVCDGDIAAFVAKMNEKAQALGMTGTHWANTNGLHDENHYTTARDMAVLAAAAQKYPDFVKIVSTPHYTLGPTNKTSTSREWKNTNKLLDLSKEFGYTYATGIKTGFTNPAMYTLVSSAVKGDTTLVAVVLHEKTGDNRWPDSVTMFEYGFTNYDTLNLVELLRDTPISADILNAAASDENKGKLQLTLLPKTQNAYITDKKDVIAALKADPSQFTQDVQIAKTAAPIKKDEVVGTVKFAYNGGTVLECDLLASRDVAEMPTSAPSSSIAANASASPGAPVSAGASISPTQNPAGNSGSLGTTLIWIGAVILLLLSALVTIRIVNMSRRNKKYRQYNYRQNGARLRR